MVGGKRRDVTFIARGNKVFRRDVMLQTVQGMKGSLGRDVVLETAQ